MVLLFLSAAGRGRLSPEIIRVNKEAQSRGYSSPFNTLESLLSLITAQRFPSKAHIVGQTERRPIRPDLPSTSVNGPRGGASSGREGLKAASSWQREAGTDGRHQHG